jgi:V-type H+-transporting ATPase proteolipid subunit
MSSEKYSELCPDFAPFFGFAGSCVALSFACTLWYLFFDLILRCSHTISQSAGLGAAYGTAKAGVGISALGVTHPGLVMKSIIPVVMAGVLGIYGLIVAVVIASKRECCSKLSQTAKKKKNNV